MNGTEHKLLKVLECAAGTSPKAIHQKFGIGKSCISKS